MVTSLPLDNQSRTWVHFCLKSQASLDGVLRWRANDVVKGMYYPMHHGQIFDWEDKLKECKTMGAMYVKAVMHSLNE